MKHHRSANRNGRAIAALAACAISLGLMSAAGCSTSSTPVPKGFVTILPGPVLVGTGGSLQIFAEATPSQVTWAITGGTGCSGSGCGTLSNPTATSITYEGPASISGSSATFTLTATSTADSSLTASQTYTIFPVAVQVSGPTPPVVAPLTSASFTAVVNGDPTTDGVSWSVSGANCTGVGAGPTNCGTLSHATVNSVIFTAPDSLAAETISVTATSIYAPGTSASFEVSLPQSTVYSYTPSTLPAAVAGQPYSATVQVSGKAGYPSTPPYTFAAQNLPSWATLTPVSPTSGTSFTISGTPPAGSQGVTSVLVTTTDSATPIADQGTQYFALTVYASAPTGNNLLKGSYTFYGSGWLDGTLPATAFEGIAYIGSFTADGNGNITGGEMDENNFQTGLSSFTNLGGTYNIQYAESGSTPQPGFQTGYITLLPGGSQNPITLAVSFRGIQHASSSTLATDVSTAADFIEFDDTTGDGASVSGGSSGQRMSGTIAQQNAAVLSQTASPLQGPFAFGMMGNTPQSTTFITSSANCFTTAPPSCGPVSLAGMFDIASTGIVSGGEEDIMIASNYYAATPASLTGSFAGGGASDSYGRMTASIVNANASTTGIFSGWPSHYIVYAIDSQHFYIMSSDSYQNFSTVIGTATAQLPAINTLPIDVTTPIALLSSVASTQYFTSTGPNGKVRAQIQVFTPTLNASSCSSGQYGLQGPQYQNLSGTSTTATVGSIGNYCNTLGANGRLLPASNSTGESEPIIYLTNTNTGYGTQWNNGSGPGLWFAIDRTSSSLNGGSYSDSMVSPTSIEAPMEVGIINLPSTGAPYNSKNVALTGTIFEQFSQTAEPYSADTGALLYTGPITGNINNNEAAYADNGVSYDGVLIKNAFTLAPANTFQGCASGYGFVVTSTSFMCIDTLDQFSTPHLFQQ